jgi:hypothetical protein
MTCVVGVASAAGLVARGSQQAGSPVVITYPAVVQGPHDPHPGDSVRWSVKLAFGSTQVLKVRGPLTEYAGTLGVISPSHCSRSPRGAGEGVSSARGLSRSW